MEGDIELARWAGEWLWPLALAGAAAFVYLALLAYEHLKVKLLLELCRAVSRRREEREKQAAPGGPDPQAEQLRSLETGLRAVLARERRQSG